MDLAIQLNLVSQPKGPDLNAASDSAFADDSASFADVLQRELATEKDSNATANNDEANAADPGHDVTAPDNPAAVVSSWLANAPLSPEPLSTGLSDTDLTGSTLVASAFAGTEFAAIDVGAGQEIAADGLSGQLIDGSPTKAELPVEPGVGTKLSVTPSQGAQTDSISAAPSAEELLFTDPITGKQYRPLAEFANALQAAGNAAELTKPTERPHLFDLIGRARDFKPSAQEQLTQSSTQSAAGDDAKAALTVGTAAASTVVSSELMAGGLPAEIATDTTTEPAAGTVTGAATAGKPVGGQSITTGSALQAATAATSDIATVSLQETDTAAVVSELDVDAVAANAQGQAKRADSPANPPSQRQNPQLNDSSAPSAAASAAASSAAVTEMEVATQSATTMAEAAPIEPASKKTNSFAEHMRQVNQQLKQQADSPAQQQASADPQQKGQEQAQQQQAALPAAQQASAMVTGAAASQTTFAGALHAEQQSAGSTSAVTPSHSVSSASVTTAASRPAAELSAPVQIYEQQAAAQLKDKVIYQVTNKIQSAEIRLNPEELGSVQIKLNLQQDQLNLQFTVSQPQAKEALEQHMPRLRELLEQQGLALAQSHVEQRSSQQQEQSRQFAGNSAGHSGQEEEVAAPTARQRASDRLVDYYA